MPPLTLYQLPTMASVPTTYDTVLDRVLLVADAFRGRELDLDVYGIDYVATRDATLCESSRSRARHRSRRRPDSATTVDPLSFDNDDHDENEVSQQLHPPVDQTPRAHQRRSNTPASSRHASPTGSDVNMANAQLTAVIFDSETFRSLEPLGRTENPHFKTYEAFVPAGPEEVAATATIQLATGNVPALVMAFETATANLDPRQIARALADPSRVLLLIPFCGGSNFHTKFTKAPADFTTAMEPVTGPGGVTISPPLAVKKLTAMGGEAKYLPPYPLLVECKTAAIKDKLIAAHVFPLTGGQLSWCLSHYKTRTGGGEGPEVFAELFRLAVGEIAFAPGPIRTLIIRLTQHETDTPDERVYAFIRTLDVVYRPHDTEPLWVLYARPCTEYFALWEKLRELIRNTTFPVGFAEFTPVGSAPRNLGPNPQRSASICWICKNDDHRSLTCPYRTLQDWEGPNEAFDEKVGVERASGRAQRGQNRGGLRQRDQNRRRGGDNY
ncbi:hypothetical protein B0H19DRAFT_1317486 [Mycena capillaripes]|nr:hypothetical protein B0H19DRAFT_1317486 [Mycena capillaripes]